MSSASVPAQAGAAVSAVKTADQSILELLRSTKLSSLPCVKGEIYIVDSKSSPSVAFQALLSHQIMGAPVLDSTAQKYIGFIDIRDIVRFVVDRYDRAEAIAVVAKRYDDALMKSAHSKTAQSGDHKSAATTTAAPAATATPATSATNPAPVKPAAKPAAADVKYAPSGRDNSANAKHSVYDYMDELMIQTDPELTSDSLSVAGLAKRHSYIELRSDATLLDAAKLMTGDAHRICVVSPHHKHTSGAPKIMNIVSQSTVVNFLHSHAGSIRPAELNAVLDCGVHSLLGVLTTDRTIDAFRKMCDRDVPGVVVRNESGWYVDRLQNSHIKLFLSRWYSVVNFERPIADFLKEVRSFEHEHRTTPAVPSKAVIVDDAPSLRVLIQALSESGSHCVYVCTRLDDKIVLPVVSVSLGDLLRTTLEYYSAAAETTTAKPGTAACTATATASAPLNPPIPDSLSSSLYYLATMGGSVPLIPPN